MKSSKENTPEAKALACPPNSPSHEPLVHTTSTTVGLEATVNHGIRFFVKHESQTINEPTHTDEPKKQ